MRSAEFGGVILESNNYGKINAVGISRARQKHPDEALTEDEQAALRSGLGKLIRAARTSRRGAINEASAAAHAFSLGVGSIFLLRKKRFKEIEKWEICGKWGKLLRARTGDI